MQAVCDDINSDALRHGDERVPGAGAGGEPGHVVQQERQRAAQERLPLLLCAANAHQLCNMGDPLAVQQKSSARCTLGQFHTLKCKHAGAPLSSYSSGNHLRITCSQQQHTARWDSSCIVCQACQWPKEREDNELPRGQ